MESLFDAIGGLPGLEFAMERFCDRVRADREMAPLFGALDMPRLKARVMARLADATDGPVEWSLSAVLIDAQELEAVGRHLAPALEEMGLESGLAAMVSERVWPVRTAVAA
jgi:truncated hemoglobin YjbI